MVRVTISLSDEAFRQLEAQAREARETPEQVASGLVAEALAKESPTPEFQAMVTRQLEDYRKAFDRLAE